MEMNDSTPAHSKTLTRYNLFDCEDLKSFLWFYFSCRTYTNVHVILILNKMKLVFYCKPLMFVLTENGDEGLPCTMTSAAPILCIIQHSSMNVFFLFVGSCATSLRNVPYVQDFTT